MSEEKNLKILKKEDLTVVNDIGILEEFFVPWDDFGNEMKKILEFRTYTLKVTGENSEAIKDIKDNDFKTFNQNFANIEASMKIYEEECLQNKNNIKNIQVELDEIKVALSHSDEKISNLHLSVLTNEKSLKTKIEKNERSINDVKSDIGAIKTDVEKSGSTLNDFQKEFIQELEATKKNVTEVKSDIENAQKFFDNFEQELEEKIEKLKIEIIEFQNNIVKNEAGIKNLEEIRTDVGVLKSDVFKLQEEAHAALKFVEIIDQELNNATQKWKKEFDLLKDSSEEISKDVHNIQVDVSEIKSDIENAQKFFDNFEQEWLKEKKQLKSFEENMIKNQKEIKDLKEVVDGLSKQEFLPSEEKISELIFKVISDYTPKLVFTANVNEESNIVEIPNYDNTKWNEFSVIYEIKVAGKKQIAHGSLRRPPNINPTINSAAVIRDIDSEHAVNLVFEPEVSSNWKAYLSLWSFATNKKKNIIKIRHYSWLQNNI